MVNTQSRVHASSADYEECRVLHKRFGTTYYFASRLFPADIRKKTHALYGFVRVPDEWVDNPDCGFGEVRQRLQVYRRDLIDGVNGSNPSRGVLRAFCEVMRESKIPLEEPLLFLDSMEQDLETTRYQTYRELQGYMRGSACAVGAMMCHVLCACLDPECLPYAMALGEAMQMTNFLRDVGEDAGRSRIYLPLEHLARFKVREEDILEGKISNEFKELMRFEIAHTRDLYRYSDKGLEYLPGQAKKAVRLARVLYGRILDHIETNDYDVFRLRARTTKGEKLLIATQVLAGLGSG